MKNQRVKCVPKGHPMTYRVRNKARALSIRLVQALNGEVPRRVLNALAAHDDTSLIGVGVNPDDFEDSATFADAYMAVSILSKAPFLELGINREVEALKKFQESEDTCASTNNRLRRLREGPAHLFDAESPETFILKARKRIARLLGPLNWDEVECLMEFGPGATRGLPHRKGDAYHKYGLPKPEVTSGCAVLGAVCVSRIPTWWRYITECAGLPGATLSEILDSDGVCRLGQIFTIVPGNRVCTVPKNAKTDRTIAIEPLLNGYIQRGLGKAIARKLKRVGIDLNDQTKNQAFAKLGSIDGSFATIDLRAASDSVSYGLLDVLLPEDWATALKLCRSPVGVLPDGSEIRYQKVSSMGNGSTFELESLIFWAIIQTLPFDGERRICVYGDDLIVPTALSGLLIDRLSFLGFSTNLDKTFVKGPFRESCGKHYFRGDDVTPIYIREDVDSPERLFWFCNQVRRYARFSWGLDGRFKRCYELGVKMLPAELRKPTIPDGVGDGALFGDFDECLPEKCHGKFRTFEGWEARIHVEIASQRVVGGIPYLLRVLAKNPTDKPLIETLSKKQEGYKVRQRKLVLSKKTGAIPIVSEHRESWVTVRCPVVQWESYGPWLGT